jgi:glycosyltransferase involved in cell wall biosynthesis
MISVIVPVYNAEKYLHRCIDSILAQTYTDFELLLIDDGSPDNSGAICDEYAAKDSRVRVFHKENGGVSSARNLGLDNVRGEWITFVDSDDYIHQDFLSSFSKKHDVGLVVGSFKVIGDEEWGGLLEEAFYDKAGLRDNIVKLALMNNFLVPWGKLFRRDIISKNNITFDERLHSGEDTLFVYNYLMYIDSLYSCDKPYYFYERGNQGLSLRISNLTHNFYAMDSFSSVLKNLEDAFDSSLSDVYNSMCKIYCVKSIQYIYRSKENLKTKYELVKKMSLNVHLKHIFLDKTELYRKKIKLFHFIMRNRFFLMAYVYIYLLKGRIYW